MLTKFMGTQGFVWFIGVVEDIQDPLKIGRVRVRCFGFHTDDKSELQTEHLPWATVLQPTTSAAQNGYGTSPTGLRINTRVFGFFADGVAAQYPVILAAFAGINNGVPIPGLQTPLPFNELQRTLEQSESFTGTVGAVGPLSESQYREWKAEIAKRESGGNLAAKNQFGFVGRYQFGALVLNDLGYVKATVRQNSALQQESSWTGKNGVKNIDAWLNNETAQESAMLELTKRNYSTLVRLGVLTTTSPPRRVSGLLAVAHLLGAGGAANYARTGQGADGNGVSGNVYYRAGYNVITDEAPKV
jgi:hypothetical protein